MIILFNHQENLNNKHRTNVSNITIATLGDLLGESCSVSKESACNAVDLSSIPRLGRSPGGGHGNPLQYSCLENPHGQRNLVGYSPWDHKELDMSEQLIFTFYRSPNRLSFWRKLMPVV